MAGRQSRARKARPGSPHVRDPEAAGQSLAGGWTTTAPPGDSRAADPDAAALPSDDPERDDPESVARLICLRMLAVAPRTHAELADALRRRGVPDAAANAVLARFAEVKLIDDATFARAWVESRHHGRGLAGRALSAELRRKGVAREDIASALEELAPGQEAAMARDLVARRLRGTRGQPGTARMRRLVGMLARKGYPPDLAYRIVREALEREAADAGRTAYYLADVAEPDTEEDVDEFEHPGRI